MIKAIIFDFDGVVAESNKVKTEAFGKLFEPEGREVVRKVVKYHLDHEGVSRFEKFKYYYQEILQRPLDDVTFQYLGQRFSELVKEGVISAPYVKGAKEFIEGRAEQYLFFVLSATPQAEMEEIIARRKLGDYFKRIYGSPAQKTAVVQEIVSAHKLKPKEVLYVGDALSDYEAAQANSINFVARTRPDNNHLFNDLTCPKISNLTNLPLIIKDLSADC